MCPSLRAIFPAFPVQVRSQKEKAFKCHLCFGDPQCVKMCPFGALTMARSEKGFLVGYPVIKGD